MSHHTAVNIVQVTLVALAVLAVGCAASSPIEEEDPEVESPEAEPAEAGETDEEEPEVSPEVDPRSPEPACEPRLIDTDFDDMGPMGPDPVEPPLEEPEVVVDGLEITVRWAAEMIATFDCAAGYNGFDLEVDADFLRLSFFHEYPTDYYSCGTFVSTVSATIEVCGPGAYAILVDGTELTASVE